MAQAQTIERWGLPYAGGWMDQPAGMLDRANVLMNVYRSFKSFAAARYYGAWAHQNPEHYRVYALVQRLKNGR